MNSKIFSLFAAASALALAGCNDDNWAPKLEKEGQLALKALAVDVNTAETLLSRADASVDVSNFIVEINQGDAVVDQWSYANMPEIITLPVGEYTAKVYSHQVQKQDWEKPYYLGSQSFKIESNAITNIGTVTCKFASLKVSIAYTDELKELMGPDCKVTVITNDEGRLEYSADETRAGYFEVVNASTTLVATFEGTVSGHQETIQRTFTDVAPGTHYRITYSVKAPGGEFPEETGTVEGSGITVDTSATDVNEGGNITIEEDVIDPGKRPGTEEPEKPDTPENPDDPKGDLFTFNNSESIDFSKPDNAAVDGETYWVEVVAKNPIESLVVEIDSEDLTDEMLRGVGLAGAFDLGTGMSVIPSKIPDGKTPQDFPEIDLNETLSDPLSFNFPTREKVKGQTKVKFDISNFVPLLNIYKGKTHSFIITVTDNAGNTESKTLSFKV